MPYLPYDYPPSVALFQRSNNARVSQVHIMPRANSVRFTSVVLALGAITGVSYGQQVLSAQSGTVHYTEGTVSLDGRELHQKNGQFATMRAGQELRTEHGRAEVLLTPGAFLRVSSNSAIRMVDNRLSDTRVEVLEGSVIAECDALLKDNAITLLYAGNTIQLAKHGLYRVDTAPAQLLVYDGEAIVQTSNGELTLKRGKETALNGALVAEKFDRKHGDSFDLWDANRSAFLASATVNASQSLLNSNSKWNTGGWYFSSYYDMYTFVPGGGAMVFSPFGYQFWSPTAMSYYYVPNYGSSRTSANSGGSTATSGIPSASGGPAGRASGGAPSFGGGGGGGGGFGGGMSSGGGARGGGGGGSVGGGPVSAGGHGR
jgi:hypothetical protein